MLCILFAALAGIDVLRSLQAVLLCNLRSLPDAVAILYQNTTTIHRSPAEVSRMSHFLEGWQNKNNPDAYFAKNTSKEIVKLALLSGAQW